jgi:hypothetical protein
VESSVCHLPSADTYSYVQEENLGSTRKFVENYLLFSSIWQSVGWRNLSKTAEKKFLQPTHSKCLANHIAHKQKYTRCAWAGGFFFAVLERFLQPMLCDGHVMCCCVSFFGCGHFFVFLKEILVWGGLEYPTWFLQKNAFLATPY